MHGKQIFVTALFLVLFLPQIAFASWWNPSSWSVFGWFGSFFKHEQTISVATTTPPIATSSVKVSTSVQQSNAPSSPKKLQTTQKPTSIVTSENSGSPAPIPTPVQTTNQPAAPTPSNQNITVNINVINPTPAPASAPSAPAPIPTASTPQPKVNNASIANDTFTLDTNFPVAIHSTQIVIGDWQPVSDPSTIAGAKCWGQASPMMCLFWSSAQTLAFDGTVNTAQKDDSGNYHYSISLAQPFASYYNQTNGSVSFGDFKVVLKSSDGDTFTSQPFEVTSKYGSATLSF